MVKFKGWSGMKQYVKLKPIKCGLKFCFRCSSKSGYLYQMYLYLGKKKSSEFNLKLCEEVVPHLTKPLEKLLWQFFLWWISSLRKNIYVIGTVRSNRKQMPKMTDDKKMKLRNNEFLFSNNVMTCKWMDNWSVLLLSTLEVEWFVDSSSKGKRLQIEICCHLSKDCQIIQRRYRGANLINQKTVLYQLDPIKSRAIRVLRIRLTY